jgi:hypothetical protein
MTVRASAKAALRHRLVVVIGRTSYRQAHPTGHRRKYVRRIHSGGYGRGFPSASTQAGSRLCHSRTLLYIRPWDQLRLSQGYPICMTGPDSWSSTAPPPSRTARAFDVTPCIDTCTVEERTGGRPACSRLTLAQTYTLRNTKPPDWSSRGPVRSIHPEYVVSRSDELIAASERST